MTYMHIVPPLALFLAKQPQIDNFDLKSLRTLVSAAAPLGDKLTEEVEQRLDVDFLQGRYCHYENLPMQYTEIFFSSNSRKFRWKKI